MLCFDSLGLLRPTPIDRYVEGSRIRDSDDTLLEPDQPPDLDLPGDHRWRLDPLPDLRLSDRGVRSNALLQRLGAEQELDDPGTCYGRVVDAGGALFLQYWFFYVDNPCVLPEGRHDGDWEFAQLRLRDSGGEYVTSEMTLAQHGKPETHRVAAGVGRPRVYVAVDSHACYFSGGTHPKFPLADDCDAQQRPQEPPKVVLISDLKSGSGWTRWKGHWGTDEGPGTDLAWAWGLHRTPAPLRWLNRRLAAGDSPVSPGWQGVSWSYPRAWALRGRQRRATNVVLRGALHFLGRLTWPRAEPQITVKRRKKGMLSVSVEPSGHGPRRIVRIALAVENAESDRALATVAIALGGGEVQLAIPEDTAIRWSAAGYNALRQRGVVRSGRVS
jgi:hypothetical protein